MTDKQLKEHCKILKRRYKQNKKNEEINSLSELLIIINKII